MIFNKEAADKVIQCFTRQKFRFDLGQGFFSILQFAVIVLSASDKIASFIHIPAKIVVPTFTLLALLGVWTFGYLLDKARFFDHYQSEMNQRNEMLQKVANSVNSETK